MIVLSTLLCVTVVNVKASIAVVPSEADSWVTCAVVWSADSCTYYATWFLRS